MLLNEFVPEQIVPKPFISLQNFVYVMFVMRLPKVCRRLQMYELKHTTPHMNLENWQCKNMLFLILFYQ